MDKTLEIKLLEIAADIAKADINGNIGYTPDGVAWAYVELLDKIKRVQHGLETE